MKKVKVTLHGILKEQVGRDQWNLVAGNVSEAIRGVQSTSKKLYRSLMENDKKNIKYRVLINGDDFAMDETKDPNTREGIMASELCLDSVSNLKTIDIVPVIEGSDDVWDWVTIIIGIALIWVGGAGIAAAGWASTSGMMVVAGIGLVAAGVQNLLTPDPEFDDFREIEGGGRPSYVFSGPQNVIREGGPVFVGYGRLLVGSQVIQTSVDYLDANAGVVKNKAWGDTAYGLRYNIPGIDGRIKERIIVLGSHEN